MKKDKIFSDDEIQKALNVVVEGDLGEVTLREYLVTLLEKLWEEKECFDGKRPFGNSGWELNLMYPLCSAGLIDGEINEDGEIYNVDEGAGYILVLASIKSLLKTQQPWKEISQAPPIAVEGRDILFQHAPTGLYHLCKNGRLYGYEEYTHWMPIPPLPEGE